MGRAAADLADLAIVTDDNPRTEDAASIRAQILEGAPSALEVRRIVPDPAIIPSTVRFTSVLPVFEASLASTDKVPSF